MKKCVVLFSGGIDSTTALYWARARYDGVSALSFDYGQRHRVELAMARRLTRRLRLPHTIIKVDLRQIGGSALTDRRIALPEVRSADDVGAGIPVELRPVPERHLPLAGRGLGRDERRPGHHLRVQHRRFPELSRHPEAVRQGHGAGRPPRDGGRPPAACGCASWRRSSA